MSCRKQWSSPPAMQVDPSKRYQATLHATKGDITIDSRLMFLCRPSVMNRGHLALAQRAAVVTPRTTDAVNSTRLTIPLPLVRYQRALVETAAAIPPATPRRGGPILRGGRGGLGGLGC